MIIDSCIGDKIGRSAVGDLIRSKNKQPVNPFPEGQALMKIAHAMGVHFSYLNRHAKLLEFRKMIPDQPVLKLKVDLNETRNAARHGLLYSEMRMNRLLKAYIAAQASSIVQPEQADWQSLAEFEGILDITKKYTVIVQYEQLSTAAYQLPIKQVLMSGLRKPYVKIVDMNKVTSQVCAVVPIVLQLAGATPDRRPPSPNSYVVHTHV